MEPIDAAWNVLKGDDRGLYGDRLTRPGDTRAENPAHPLNRLFDLELPRELTYLGDE